MAIRNQHDGVKVTRVYHGEAWSTYQDRSWWLKALDGLCLAGHRVWAVPTGGTEGVSIFHAGWEGPLNTTVDALNGVGRKEGSIEFEWYETVHLLMEKARRRPSWEDVPCKDISTRRRPPVLMTWRDVYGK